MSKCVWWKEKMTWVSSDMVLSFRIIVPLLSSCSMCHPDVPKLFCFRSFVNIVVCTHCLVNGNDSCLTCQTKIRSFYFTCYSLNADNCNISFMRMFPKYLWQILLLENLSNYFYSIRPVCGMIDFCCCCCQNFLLKCFSALNRRRSPNCQKL